MTLRYKAVKNSGEMQPAWGKSFSGPPCGSEKQRTYEDRTRLHLEARCLTGRRRTVIINTFS